MNTLQSNAIHRKQMGLPLDERHELAYLSARDAGLIGGKLDKENSKEEQDYLEKQTTMDEGDSLAFKQDGIGGERVEALQAAAKLDEAQEYLARLLIDLHTKEDGGESITRYDVDGFDLEVAQLVATQREKEVETLRESDPKWFDAITKQIEERATKLPTESLTLPENKTAVLIAKIDAAEKLVTELHEKLDTNTPEDGDEIETKLIIALSERDQLIAQLTEAELTHFYALTA